MPELFFGQRFSRAEIGAEAEHRNYQSQSRRVGEDAHERRQRT